MPTEIDALSISIETKAQKANSSIDKLVSRLDVLSNSLGKLQNGSNNLVALGRGVESLSRGMQGFKGVGEAKFIRLANGINQLSNINSQGISNAARSLQQISSAFDRVGGMSGNAVQVSDLAKNLGKLGNKSVTNAITNIPKLATAMNNLMTTLSKAPKVSENVIRMTNALANLSAQGAKVGSTSNSIVRGLNRASRSATRARASFGGLASAIGKFYATYFLFFRAFRGLWKSINMTADYVEAFNYFTVSMGKIASKWDADWENYADDNARNYANKFVTTLNKTFSKLSGVSYDPQTGLLSETGLENLGLNLQEVTQYAAQLSSMMDAVGQSGEVTLATTNAFVKLAGDISSLFNIDYQDAADKIRSVLQGQSRAGYGFGWDTTAAALQETAEKFGITKAVSEMAQWEKQQLRILTILEQSRVAYGDQSNTINTLANQIRLFKNNIKEAGMLLGQLFVPMLTKIMPIVNGVTIAIKRLLSSIATLLGIEIKDIGQGFSDLDDGTEDLSDGLDDVAKSAKKAYMGLLGFDKLNVIKSPDTSTSGYGNGSGGGGIDLTDEILQATSEYEKVWQEAFENMENRAQDFADEIEEIFSPITDPFANLDWETITKNLADFAKALEPWADNFGEGFIEFWGDVSETTAGIIEKLFGEDGTILKVTDWLNNNDPEKAKKWGYAFGVLAFGLGAIVVVAGTAALITKLATSLSFLGGALAIVAAAYAGIKGGNLIGKLLFPEDAQWYENFKIFGKDGFLSIISEDWETTMQALFNASYDFQEIPFIKSMIGFANTNYAVDIVKWFREDLQPWFTKEKWEEILSGLPQAFDNAFRISVNFVIDGLNALIDGFEQTINGIITGLQAFVDENKILSSALGIGIGSVNASTISLGRIPAYKMGGMPEDGLFYANHTELVGKFSNGKTAVANNQQITDGIEEAAYRGMMRALATQGGSANVNVTLEGDANRLFRVVRKEADTYLRTTGRPAF